MPFAGLCVCLVAISLLLMLSQKNLAFKRYSWCLNLSPREWCHNEIVVTMCNYAQRPDSDTVISRLGRYESFIL